MISPISSVSLSGTQLTTQQLATKMAHDPVVIAGAMVAQSATVIGAVVDTDNGRRQQIALDDFVSQVNIKVTICTEVSATDSKLISKQPRRQEPYFKKTPVKKGQRLDVLV